MISVLEKIYLLVSAIAEVFADASIYILVGFAAAGLMNALIPPVTLYRYLGGKRKRSVLLAALIGVPLPLCSCSVLPAALNLRKKGAGKGASMAFLISTPETGVESIALTYGLMGGVTAVFRPFAAFVTAMVTGLATTFWGGDEEEEPEPEPDCCDQGCSARSSLSTNGPAETTRPSLVDSMREVFGSFFDETAYWLLLGLLLSGFIAAVVPDSVFENVLGSGAFSMLFMLVLGIPIYICASSSTPIAAVMVMKGLNPGAALVFLLAGPASNLGSMAVLAKYFGRRTMLIYLISIALVSLLMGALFNLVISLLDIDLALKVESGMSLMPVSIRYFGLVFFGLLTVRALRRSPPPDEFLNIGRKLNLLTGSFFTRTRALRAAVLIGILLYAGTTLVAVEPGEEAVVKRFGKPARNLITPGLHFKAPFPFDTVEKCRAALIRSTPLGFLPVSVTDSSFNPLISGITRIQRKKIQRETVYVTGDENLLDATAVVFYRVKEIHPYLFEISLPDDTVKRAAKTALLSILIREPIDRLLAENRHETELKAAKLLQRRLDKIGSGIEVVSLDIIDVHAPGEVHFAFRDLASATEDKLTKINNAYIYAQTTTHSANGRATAMTEGAAAAGDSATADANGEAHAFELLAASHGKYEKAMEVEMYLETIENSLEKAEKFIVPGGGDEPAAELWCLPGSSTVRERSRK